MSIPKVSVIVGAYRPDLHKMLLTLRSILLQKKCSYEIILTDDGSKENYFAEVKDFFARAPFSDYKLLPSEKNQGTVLNVWKALQVAQGEYIRLISPGDFMHGFLHFMIGSNSWRCILKQPCRFVMQSITILKEVRSCLLVSLHIHSIHALLRGGQPETVPLM